MGKMDQWKTTAKCNKTKLHVDLLNCNCICQYNYIDGLTQLPLDKMAAILADVLFKCIFMNENDRITFVPMSPIDNMPALVQLMAWRRTGDKPLSEPMLTRFTDAYMRHKGRWVNREEMHLPNEVTLGKAHCSTHRN